MQPNYPQQPTPPPAPGPGIEYLNSIAAPTTTKTLNPFILWGLIGATLLAVIFTVIGFTSSGNGPTEQLTRVGAMASNLQELSTTADSYIQSSELRSINSGLNITLTNTNRDLDAALKAKEINIKNTKKNSTAAAVAGGFEQVAQRLEDARLNGVYDRTYVREVAYLLKMLHADMEKLHNSSNDKQLKAILETNDNNLALLLNDLEAVSAN